MRGRVGFVPWVRDARLPSGMSCNRVVQTRVLGWVRPVCSVANRCVPPVCPGTGNRGGFATNVRPAEPVPGAVVNPGVCTVPMPNHTTYRRCPPGSSSVIPPETVTPMVVRPYANQNRRPEPLEPGNRPVRPG